MPIDIKETREQLEQAQRPWYLRRIDLPRACKTGEVIEATPLRLATKLKIIGLGVAVGAPMFLAEHWFFKDWVPRYYKTLDVLAKTDPVASALKVTEFVSLLLLAPVLTGLISAMWVLVRCYRVFRAGRWPLPGAKVRRRTEVVAGWWCVRLPMLGFMVMWLALMIFIWVCYLQLLGMFWDGYLDKQLQAHRKSIQMPHRMLGNKLDLVMSSSARTRP
jgi:hypothetical protein